MLEMIIDNSVQDEPFLFASDVSDADLEAAAGDVRGLFCSCSGCNSACSNDSR